MKTLPRTTIILCALFLFVPPAFAQGRRTSLLSKSEYFHIYGQQDVDVPTLLTKLNFNYLLQLESLNGPQDPESRDVLAKTMDALYAEVSDILNINVYSFHGNIKFLRDRKEVEGAYYRIYRADFKEPSFYYHDRNTIYISYADLTLEMMGHKIAEAILAHYFVVPPTEKIQEVLSGYVEYSLREASGTLPEDEYENDIIEPSEPEPETPPQRTNGKMSWIIAGLTVMLVLGVSLWKTKKDLKL